MQIECSQMFYILATFAASSQLGRLAEFGAGSINPSQGIAETTFNIDGNLMSLQFDTTTSSTPFAPNFFSRVRLPVRLFEDYEIDQTQ